jgi:hypothetical protein
MVNLLGLNSRTIQSLFDHDGTKLNCGCSGKTTSHGSDCGTACTCQNYFLCHPFSPLLLQTNSELWLILFVKTLTIKRKKNKPDSLG